MLHAVDADGNLLRNATVSIQQTRPGFPFGSAITAAIINNPAYQSWFASRFTVTVFENEMKWYSTERSPGREDYSQADAMVAFAKQHGIRIRGHNVLWDDPQYQMDWVRSLSGDQFRAATDRRVNSIVSRYRGQLIAWDVVNENLHFSFFESRLGASASATYYQRARELDPNTLMFLNDYNTLEQPGDGASTPAKYLQKLREMQASGARMAIGLESHFSQPNIPFMRSALDLLARANVPIWLTSVMRDLAGSILGRDSERRILAPRCSRDRAVERLASRRQLQDVLDGQQFQKPSHWGCRRQAHPRVEDGSRGGDHGQRRLLRNRALPRGVRNEDQPPVSGFIIDAELEGGCGVTGRDCAPC